MSTIMDDPRHGGVNVEFVDVGSIMAEKVEIDLLKCDIEGAELLFLENYGDLLGKVRHAVFELHHAQCDTDKCVSILENAGFRGTMLRANDSFSVSFYRRA